MEVERRTDGRTEVHANSTFDEMRAREIKVELGRRGADLGAVEEAAAARRPGRTVESRRTDGRTDGRTDAFATHFSTFPGNGVSEQGAGEQGERIPA